MKELFNPKLVIKQFNDAADTYDNTAIMQKNAADGLLERLEMIKLDVKNILDLGAGTGYCSKKLLATFPEANIVALDTSEQMLSKIESKKITCLSGEAEKIPLSDDSVDLVISNMMLHWSLDIPTVFNEVNRVLKKDGLFLYTTLGPDTLHELRESWASVDDYNHVHHFYDMHDLGDAMLGAGFSDPVLDMQMLTLRYRELKKLFRDFKELGVRNIAEPRKPGLTTKNQYLRLLAAYEKFKIEDSYPVSYEILFGHSWGETKQNPGEYRVSVEGILKANTKS